MLKPSVKKKSSALLSHGLTDNCRVILLHITSGNYRLSAVWQLVPVKSRSTSDCNQRIRAAITDTEMPSTDAPTKISHTPAPGGQAELVVATAANSQRNTAGTAIPGGSSSGGNLYQQTNQCNQANLYQSLTVVNPGYTVQQVRDEMSQLMNEAERRRHMSQSVLK